jgi:NADH-quinone oxidoreductase subunit C
MNPMAGEERLEVARLRNLLGGDLGNVKEDRGDTFVCVPAQRIVDAIRTLKEDEELQYDYFVECVGVDYSRWDHERDLPQRFEVVYNLYSTKHSSRLFVKVGVNDGESIPTLKEVFLGAEYPEKEIADLFGILFAGNEFEPGERFMLPDDWSGFPLRKEYPLGGEDVLFDQGDRGPAVEDVSMPHAGESFEGKTGSEDVSGR